MDIFNLDNDCLFCDGECTCIPTPTAKPSWHLKLKPGSPVFVDKLMDRKDVWVVVISVDRFNETIICFDKNSGRHEDIKWSKLKPTVGYAD